jgi:hypothetical protein
MLQTAQSIIGELVKIGVQLVVRRLCTTLS